MAIIDDKVLKPIRDAAKANQERRVAQATIKKEYNKELKKKTDDIINKKTQLDFSLVPSGLEDMIQEYAIENKDDYAKAAAIVAKLEGDSGNDLYKAAVTLMNRIDKGMLKMKNTIDAINTTQKVAFDRSKANTNALSMTDDEEMNFHNILQGNYNTPGGIQVRRDGHNLYFTSANGEEIDPNNFSNYIGSEYSNELERSIDKMANETRTIGQKHGYSENKGDIFIEANAQTDIENLVEDQLKINPKAVTNLFYQKINGKDPLIDLYISEQVGIPKYKEDNVTLTDEWKEFTESGIIPGTISLPTKKITGLVKAERQVDIPFPKKQFEESGITPANEEVWEDKDGNKWQFYEGEWSRLGEGDVAKMTQEYQDVTTETIEPTNNYQDMLDQYKNVEKSEELRKYFVDHTMTMLKKEYDISKEASTSARTGKSR